MMLLMMMMVVMMMMIMMNDNNNDDDDDEGDGDDFGENSSRLLWMETIRLNSELKSPKILGCTFA